MGLTTLGELCELCGMFSVALILCLIFRVYRDIKAQG